MRKGFPGIAIPGQVPGKSTPLSERPKLNPEIERMLMETPPGFSIDRHFEKPIMRAKDAVSNLGLSKSLESSISFLIQKEAIKSTNQLTFQKAINSSMMESGLPYEVQSIISNRAKSFYSRQLEKSSRNQTFTLQELKKAAAIAHPPAKGTVLPKSPEMASEEAKAKKKVQEEMGIEAPKQPMTKSLFVPGSNLSKAEKGEHIGGKFVARVSKEGKHKYYYDEEKYKAEHGEHVTGEEARKNHVHGKVHKATEAAGEHGTDIMAFKDLVKKYGAKDVHESVKKHCDEGTMKFKAGRFYHSKGKK